MNKSALNSYRIFNPLMQLYYSKKHKILLLENRILFFLLGFRLIDIVLRWYIGYYNNQRIVFHRLAGRYGRGDEFMRWPGLFALLMIPLGRPCNSKLLLTRFTRWAFCFLQSSLRETWLGLPKTKIPRYRGSNLSLRREGDSNPRYSFPYGSLANCWFKPLTHLSKYSKVLSATKIEKQVLSAK